MDIDAKILKAYGIVLGNSSLVAKAYDSLRGIAVLPIEGKDLLVLDLNSLPTKPIPFKEVFLRWALRLNEGRMLAGEDPIFPFELVKACPLWKTVRMPLRRLDMTQEGMFNKPLIKGVSKAPKLGSINKK
jgi:hypothetical protein